MLDIDFYKKIYYDVENLNDRLISKHFNTIGKNENRIANEDEHNERKKKRFSREDDNYYIRKVKIICIENGIWWNLLDKYFYRIEKPSLVNISAVIDLNYYKNYEEYFATVKKKNKKSYKIVYEVNKSIKQGFFCQPFIKSNFLPDIYDIHTSSSMRSGVLMSDSYNRTAKEMGYTNCYINTDPLKYIRDINNYMLCIGIFKKIDGYKQGSNITNKKLIGYITLCRVNNFITYDMIIGHSEYLRYGIMYHLHFYIFENYIYSNIKLFNSIDYLIYGGYYHGSKDGGLTKWKKKFLFEPYELTC